MPPQRPSLGRPQRPRRGPGAAHRTRPRGAGWRSRDPPAAWRPSRQGAWAASRTAGAPAAAACGWRHGQPCTP
eukprot:4128415-Alexandrium_andersonii.AAC.1